MCSLPADLPAVTGAWQPAGHSIRPRQTLWRPLAIPNSRGYGTAVRSSTARGALIVFEGIDRCGKSTQSSRLAEHLRQQRVPVQQWHFPDRTTTIGCTIDAFLRNKKELDPVSIHLLFTANRFEKRLEMLRLLASGTTLVVDRYSYSGMAYSAAKGLVDLPLERCRSVEVGLPAADLTLYMDISPEASAVRSGYGDERYEKLDFQRKVRAQFELLAKDGTASGSWVRLNAANDPDTIQQQVLAAVAPVIAHCHQGAPLQRQWDGQELSLPVLASAPASAGSK